jgi:hypothetical protein
MERFNSRKLSDVAVRNSMRLKSQIGLQLGKMVVVVVVGGGGRRII